MVKLEGIHEPTHFDVVSDESLADLGRRIVQICETPAYIDACDTAWFLCEVLDE